MSHYKIKVNKNETYEDQCDKGRRPRINFHKLYEKIKDHTNIIFDGHIEFINNEILFIQ